MFTNKTPWIVLLLLWMGGSTWWHVCRIKQLCGDTSPGASVSAPSVLLPPLTIADGTRLNLNVAGNFSFAKSGTVANEAAVGNTLQTVADYLRANPSRMLEVTGYYHPEEQNSGQYINLGTARAEYITIKLIAMGVSANQLAAKGLSAGSTSPMPYSAKGDSLYGGLAFAFGEKKVIAVDSTATGVAKTGDGEEKAQPDETTQPDETSKSETALAKAQKFTSVFKPIDLYFEYGKQDYIETDDTKTFFEEAEAYLKEHKGKKLVLRGYTDNEGAELDNVKLSRERASTVKERLVKKGVKSGQIKVMAKGESEPKESNATEAGRRANRRVSAVVQ